MNGELITLAPFCTSQRCTPSKKNHELGLGAQVKKDLSRVKNDICQDCGYYITWLHETPLRNKNFVRHVINAKNGYRFPG
jgi:hypothetical protein